MKTHSAGSVSTPAGNTLNALNGKFSAAKPAAVRPSPETSIPDLLRRIKPRFLEGFTSAEHESILAVAQFRRFAPDAVIMNQDHPASDLFLLLTGRARYFFVTEKGQKVILLWIPPGEIFGLASLMPSSHDYDLSTEAVRNSSALVWDRAVIRSLAARHPRLLENAFYMVMHYLAAYRTAHRALICGNARERLALVLVSLARGIGQKVAGGVELNIRNEELANEANVTVFTASRLLSEWQRKGMLAKGRNKILLRSPELLLQYAA